MVPAIERFHCCYGGVLSSSKGVLNSLEASQLGLGRKLAAKGEPQNFTSRFDNIKDDS